MLREKPSFDDFYRENYPKVMHYLRARLSDTAAAEDLSSDIFLYCYDRYESYDPEKSSVKNWLFVIVNSRLKNYYRDRRPFASFEDIDELLPGVETDMERSMYIEQLRDKLHELLHALPERQREVIVSRFYREESYETIARRLQITPQNARVLLSRALDRLEQQFQDFSIYT